MQKARGQLARSKDQIRLPQLVGKRFQVLFHSPLGVLFTFPSRYWFTIGRQRVLSLTRWSSQIPTGFHVSRGTWVHSPGSPSPFEYRAVTFYGAPFQKLPLELGFLTSRRIGDSVQVCPTTPMPQRSPPWHDTGLGCFPFARRY